MADPSRIVVLAPNWLGDAVMALPAIADLRRRYLHATLVIAARRSVARLFAMVGAVNEVVELEWRGRALDVGALRRDVRRLRGVQAGAAILLPNSFASAWLARSARIPERWGYAGDLRSALLTRAVPRPAPGLHQGRYYQHLLAALGVPSGPLHAQLTVGAKAKSDAHALLTRAGWDGIRPLVVLAPGAAYGTAKRWPPAHYASLAADLAAQGAHCVLVGSAGDADAAGEVVARLPQPARPRVSDLCGRTTLETLAGVLSQAGACVSNDSGAMHVAAASGAPLAALFGPTRERETAPLPWPGVRADVLIHHVPCRPCMLRECPIDHPCMRDLEPSRVLATVRDLLARGRSDRPSERGARLC